MEAAIRAIAEPRRREILRLVWDAERPAGDIAAHFDVSRPAISQHLRVLREAGLVSERRAGTMRLYRARREGVAELRAYLDRFWDEGLVTLKREAEREERKRGLRVITPSKRRTGGGPSGTGRSRGRKRPPRA
jgi:DNA-binding transcriptional ArsR family regulator